jgi:isopentenyl diphosphate isomerase/L-lactate dehydrogenase-like FMN-dependent dehydrogenase
MIEATSTPIPMRVWAGRIEQIGEHSTESKDLLNLISNSEAFYKWRIIPRTLVDTNVRDLTST